MAENTVSVQLTIEQAQALSALSNLNRGLDEFAKKAQSSTNKAESSFNSFGKTVAAVFTGEILVEFAKKAVEALAEIPKELAEIVKLGAESAAATNKLGIALALSGNSSEEAAQKFDGLITSISKLTGVDDDAVKGAATLALTLGATDKQAEKILKTAADLSVGLGVDFNTAVQQLSQTLEGSAGRLGKVSSEVRKLDEDALKSGKAIDILAKQFGGLADANAGNLDVQFRNIGVNIENLKKSFGEAVVGNDAFKAAVLVLNDGLEQLNQFIKANGQTISEFTTSAVEGIKTFIEATTALYDAVVRVGAVIKNVFELGIGSIAAAMNAANAAILSGGNALREFFGLEPNPDARVAVDQLNESVNSLVTDSADLQKALGPDAFAPGVQAAFNLAGSVEQANARIQASNELTEKKKQELEAQGKANRAAEDAQRLAEEQAFQDQVLAIKQQALVTQLEAEAQARDQNIIFRQDETALIEQFELTKINLQFDAQAKKIALMADGKKKEQELELNAANRSKAISEATTKFELEQQKIRNQNLRGSLDSIATLTSQSNKELFAIGKASALATATIDGIAAVQKALASAPPPFNFVLASLVGTVQALNLSKIASQQPPSFAQGGIVPGTSFVGDKVAANVNSGEMVLNKQQQANLFEQANNGGGGAGVIAAIESLGNKIAAIRQEIIIDGREIARVVRDQRESGFAV